MNVEELVRKDAPEGVYFGVRVQPRAGRNKILGIHNGCLKLAVAAAPVEGEATRQCLRFLAEIFNVALPFVSLLSGAQSRNKVFRIAGMESADCRRILGKIS